MTVYTKDGWAVADKDEQPRPETTLEGLGKLRTPFRVMGRVTAGNSSGLNDGAAGAILMTKDKAEELGIQPKMELKSFAYAGVKPEIMGIGPIPATHKALSVAELTMKDIGLVELNEAFAVAGHRIHEGIRFAVPRGSAHEHLRWSHCFRSSFGVVRCSAGYASHARIRGAS